MKLYLAPHTSIYNLFYMINFIKFFLKKTLCQIKLAHIKIETERVRSIIEERRVDA